MTGHVPPAILAQPYSSQELADFEVLIFASNDPDNEARLKARANLAAFVGIHGTAKCDMMLEALSAFHDKPQRPDA